jgi:hypothetical protein
MISQLVFANKLFDLADGKGIFDSQELGLLFFGSDEDLFVVGYEFDRLDQ